MSKRKREAIEKAAAASKVITNPAENNSLQDDASRQSRWKKLSFQGKLLTILVIGLLSLSAVGATMKYLEDSARQNSANSANPNGENEQSLLARLNPFAPASMISPTPTPLPLSKEYIYAGSRLLAVEDANASAAPPADLAVFRPSTGGWWVLNASGQGYVGQNWGTPPTDRPVQGDYDGDGKTDFAIYHPADGSWQVLQSSNSAYYGFQFGLSTDKTAQADYDGDGETDLAIYRDLSGQGYWYIRNSSNASVLTQQFGLSTDLPAPADYDGDGKADIAVWRNSNQTFYSLNSSNNTMQTIAILQSSIEPVSGDYDGDGLADYAVRSGASWYIRNSTTGTITTTTPSNDLSSDIAVQNDYDGDGKVDIAVWRGSNGNWYIRKSGSGGALRQEQWGISGDIPVPSFYRR